MDKTSRTWTCLASAVLAAVLLMACVPEAEGDGTAGKTAPLAADADVLLQCSPEIAISDADYASLCDDVMAALEGAMGAGGAVALDDGSATPAYLVTLAIVFADNHTVRGRLDWRKGRDGAVTIGPVVEFAVLDAEIRSTMLVDFAAALVTATSIPLTGD